MSNLSDGGRNSGNTLFNCSWTRAVRYGSNLNLRVEKGAVPNVGLWTSNQMGLSLSKSETKTLLSKVAATGWYIWKSRNEFAFNKQPVDPLATLHRFYFFWNEQSNFLSSNHGPGQLPTMSQQNTVSGWRPPPLGKLKINCDASFCNHHSCASIAAVMRDSHDGHLVDGIARAIDASSIVSAEAQAVRMACVMAHSYNLSYVEIESDSQMVINLCVSETVPPWESSAVLLDIREFAAQHQLSFS